MIYMQFITINEKFENPNFNGTEAKLYIKGDFLYKIYNEKTRSCILHLLTLGNKQKYVQKTTLPDAVLIDEEGLIGCRIKYFKNYKLLNKQKNIPLKEKLIILEQIIKALKELLDNNIYPEDLNSKGILVNNDIQIIDLDTFTTKITDYEDKEVYDFVLKLFRNVLFEIIYSDFEPIIHLKNLSDYLKSKHLNSSIIKDLSKNDFSFKDANNFIYSLKK